MIVRKLWPWELGAVGDHLLRLDPEDRLMRFGAPVSDQFIERRGDQIDPAGTIVLGCFIDGVLRGVAELIRLPGEHPPAAELGVSVERPFQDQGIGGRLFDAALTVAQNRLVRAVHVVFLPENAKMRHLLARAGATIETCATSGEASIALAWPGPASILEEVSMEYAALAGRGGRRAGGSRKALGQPAR
jgi:RimJ/RimL family protein N-acetyltransferase